MRALRSFRIYLHSLVLNIWKWFVPWISSLEAREQKIAPRVVICPKNNMKGHRRVRIDIFQGYYKFLFCIPTKVQWRNYFCKHCGYTFNHCTWIMDKERLERLFPQWFIRKLSKKVSRTFVKCTSSCPQCKKNSYDKNASATKDLWRWSGEYLLFGFLPTKLRWNEDRCHRCGWKSTTILSSNSSSSFTA